ncbi:MAG TPA: twin-arginine translocase subunit TatC [Bryobacteraceae bacterium]|jgi:sec-independent protein translocase protein TatC
MADDNSNPDPKTPPEEPVKPPVDEAARVEESDPYAYGEDPYAYEQYSPATPEPVVAAPEPAPPAAKPNPVIIPGPPPKLAGNPPKPPTPPKPPPKEEEEDPDEEGMARMSFVEHLEELRSRLIRSLIGFGLSFLGCMFFAPEIWRLVSEPALSALRHLGANPPVLIAISPMEQFNTIWIKAPIIVSIFVASPIILYQIWAFISPGLYKRERRWAIPFIVCTSGLFITGGLFAYFIVFRFGLEFLLGIGRDVGVQPFVTISEYFDLFVNVMLGVGLVFELPVLIFFLALLRIASPRFLIQHSRYAILAIVIIAAVVTPTPDVFNLMLFAVPMIALYFVGVFAAYLLQLKREGKKFPWGILALVILGILLLVAGGVAVMVLKYHFKLLYHWPFLTK